MVSTERSIFLISNHLNSRLILEIIEIINTYVRVAKEAKLVVIEGEILFGHKTCQALPVFERKTKQGLEVVAKYIRRSRFII